MVVSSSNFGGSRWMGSAPSRLNGLMPSMASPVTFINRPFTCSPVGILMGDPKAIASMPLRSPSVVSIATVRTVFSPICCCTSTINCLPSGRERAIAS